MASNVPHALNISSLTPREEEEEGEGVQIVNDPSAPPSSPHPPQYSEIPGVVPLSEGRPNCPPPSYDDVVNPEAPPPSYQSLFGQVLEARKNSSNVLDFLRKVIIILLGTIGCTILIGVTFVIPISMIAIGATYRRECPVEEYIPLYLVVGGVFGVLKNSMNFYGRMRRIRDQNAEENLQPKPHESLLNCFLLAWFIAGCCWIYRVYEPEYVDTSSSFYCNKTLYMFAFWLVTTIFIVVGLMSICVICFVASSVLTSLD